MKHISKKLPSIKLTALLLLLFFLFPMALNGENTVYIETVNARKSFFYTVTDWETLFKKHEHDEYISQNTRLFTDKNKSGYILIFYPCEEGTKKPKAYGKIRYTFNANKELTEVDVWFLENNGSYLKFKANKTFDVYLFSELYKQNLSYHFSFESLKYLSLNSILSVLGNNNLDSQLLITREDYKQKEQFVNKIIGPSLSPGIFVEDGARNEFGDFVYINDGSFQEGEKGFNCSGYVKEVADNYLRFLQPGFKFLTIEELKERRLSERKKTSYIKYETQYDPYFGSDWVRNLVDRINSTLDFSIIRAEEIKDDRFAQYHETYGYNLDQLQNILFRDQQSDSSYFYIVVFNTLRKLSPVIPEFYHIAVIVPYFKGRHFYLYVFESGCRTSYSTLIKNQLNTSIDKKVFENNILPKIESKTDRLFLKKMYKHYSRGKLYLQKNVSLDQAVRISRILNRIEYKTKKTLIFKVPIKNFY